MLAQTEADAGQNLWQENKWAEINGLAKAFDTLLKKIPTPGPYDNHAERDME